MKTKKILTIPDLHGKTIWKNVFDPSYDNIVFLGDFVDSETHTDDEILDNLSQIILIKKQYPDKVILLIGNHELHYLYATKNYRGTGFRPSMFTKLNHIFTLNKPLFQYSFQYKNYIWSHAGIHSGWYNYRFRSIYSEDTFFISDELNNEYNKKTIAAVDPKVESLFDIGRDRDGRAKVGGPLWVSKNTLWLKGIHGFNQIVGHTPISKIMTCTIYKNKTLNGSVTFCDCLDKKEDYYKIEI